MSRRYDKQGRFKGSGFRLVPPSLRECFLKDGKMKHIFATIEEADHNIFQNHKKNYHSYTCSQGHIHVGKKRRHQNEEGKNEEGNPT